MKSIFKNILIAAVFYCAIHVQLSANNEHPLLFGSRVIPGSDNGDFVYQRGQTRRIDFNDGWKFVREGLKGAEAVEFADDDWLSVRLPHDWSVGYDFDRNLDGATGYLPGGVGWYRKTFNVDLSDNEKAFILFDGIYNHADVYLNGKKLGYHPYGYSPFYYDITEFLDDGKNVMAIRVDRTRYVDSRWYTGAGIYRNVDVVVVDKLHIPIWGTFVTTPKVSKEEASVVIDLKIQNDYLSKKEIVVKSQIINQNDRMVAETQQTLVAGAMKLENLQQTLMVENPELWGVESPYLYQVNTTIQVDGEVVDSYQSHLGIRSIRFDANEGFFLNGENMKIKGVCLHHDGGLVGAAVPKAVWERRLQILRDAGCNAIRISHNPASDEFLDLCDEMGFLVQDEFFDEWDYPKDKRLNMYERHDDYVSKGYAEWFQEWAESDLKTTLVAHRNHPCIFQWSIGNEIEWTYPRNRPSTGFFDNMNWDGNYFWSPPPYSPEKIRAEYDKLPALEYQIENTAKKLSKWTKELDTTRPVIANCILPSASFETGYADVLDIVGFSYRRVMYDYAKEHYPNKIVMGTENVGQWHEWKAIMERPYISGTFLWTGIDYMGESHGSHRWPQKDIASGLIDQAGFENPAFHMYKTLWQDDAHIYVSSNKLSESEYQIEGDQVVEKNAGAWEQRLWFWYPVNEHWNYEKDDEVIVEVISNCPEVELLLNEKSLGVKRLDDFEDRIYKWFVPYEAGKLVAKGKMLRDAVSTEIVTSGEPDHLELHVDKTVIDADGYDVAHVVVQLHDKDGHPVLVKDAEIVFSIDGPFVPHGVDNGAPTNVQKYQSLKVNTHKGRALLIVRSTKESGSASISASSNGLSSNTIRFRSE